MKDLREMADELWREAKRQGLTLEQITFRNDQMVSGNSNLVRVEIDACLNHLPPRNNA